jgi:hypothetical protein
MAAPARPAIVNEGGLLRYQSLDNVDRTLYNNLQAQYQRTAFLAVIERELTLPTGEGKYSQAQFVRVLMSKQILRMVTLLPPSGTNDKIIGPRNGRTKAHDTDHSQLQGPHYRPYPRYSLCHQRYSLDRQFFHQI